MTASPFSIRLEPELKSRLRQEAERSDRSIAYVAQKAISQYLDALEAKRAAIRAALARADEGFFLSEGEVHSWIESWGEGDEKPAPTSKGSSARRA